jgi:hypothetical protein
MFAGPGAFRNLIKMPKHENDYAPQGPRSAGKIRSMQSRSAVVSPCFANSIALRVSASASPSSCKIGLSNHSRIWPEQIELFVFQSSSDSSIGFA